MHCRACDKPLNEHEIYIDERTGDFETLCSGCKQIALAAAGMYLTDEAAIAMSRSVACATALSTRSLEGD